MYLNPYKKRIVMKKCLLIISCIFSLFTQAAESNKPIMCLAGNALFLVSKDDICGYEGILGVIAVGKREQDRFKKYVSDKKLNVIGTAFCVQDKKVYVLPKISQSSSDDNSYKRFAGNSKLYKKAEIEEVQCDLMHVIEPVIKLKAFGKHIPQTCGYSPYRIGAENPYDVICHNFLGDTALEQAGNDLALCYQNALVKGLEVIKNKENKSIGLVTFSTETGLPRKQAIPITFETITHFLEAHKDHGYSFVHLFVRKNFELKKYKELMMEYDRKNRR
jgi:hypothetical protein